MGKARTTEWVSVELSTAPFDGARVTVCGTVVKLGFMVIVVAIVVGFSTVVVLNLKLAMMDSTVIQFVTTFVIFIIVVL